MEAASVWIPGYHRNGISDLKSQTIGIKKTPPCGGEHGWEVLLEAQSQAQRKTAGSNPALPSIGFQGAE